VVELLDVAPLVVVVSAVDVVVLVVEVVVVVDADVHPASSMTCLQCSNHIFFHGSHSLPVFEITSISIQLQNPFLLFLFWIFLFLCGINNERDLRKIPFFHRGMEGIY
jgi:hypothetical protein